MAVKGLNIDLTIGQYQHLYNIMCSQEQIIDTLSYCDDLSDPAFSMYETMNHAVDTEVYYPLYDQ